MPKVILENLNKTYELKVDDILYDGLDQQGEELPHGCLSGSCGACRIEILEGAENLEKAGFIEQNTIEALATEYEKKFGADHLAGKTIRLSCRAKIKGNIRIKPLD